MEQAERIMRADYQLAREQSVVMEQRAYCVGEERVAAEANAAHSVIVQNIEQAAQAEHDQAMRDVRCRALENDSNARRVSSPRPRQLSSIRLLSLSSGWRLNSEN